jgi:crotonobetainyl-CoA:carnitine CoA-transferase CaiB-like acyl-CoA transferase
MLRCCAAIWNFKGKDVTMEGMLSPYRALDLTDEKGLLCGKILGDLGADVVKIEKPGGDPSRRLGPFYHDEADPEKSLFWFAYNANKRGITLDIEKAEGRELFKRLVKTADFVIESFPSGYLGGLGLGYEDLERLNPRIIAVSITPFGQTGPFKDYKAPNIVAWAMGGEMYTRGDVDRAPVQMGHHSQAYLHAGGEAAAVAMMALYWREMTGEGQHVDVSIQESVAQLTYMHTSAWDILKNNQRRVEVGANIGLTLRRIWQCKDGYVYWMYSSLALGRGFMPLIEWMESEGLSEELKEFDWDRFDWKTTTQEVIDRLESITARFFLARTKAELFEGATKRRLAIYPLATAVDILDSPQLVARDYWTKLEYPGLGTLTVPGAFAHSTETPPRLLCRAPFIGEHNREVYEQELGLSSDELLTLKRAGVI